MITEGTQEGSWISLRKALCSSAKLIKYYWLKSRLSDKNLVEFGLQVICLNGWNDDPFLFPDRLSILLPPVTFNSEFPGGFPTMGRAGKFCCLSHTIPGGIHCPVVSPGCPQEVSPCPWEVSLLPPELWLPHRSARLGARKSTPVTGSPCHWCHFTAPTNLRWQVATSHSKITAFCAVFILCVLLLWLP